MRSRLTKTHDTPAAPKRPTKAQYEPRCSPTSQEQSEHEQTAVSGKAQRSRGENAGVMKQGQKSYFKKKHTTTFSITQFSTQGFQNSPSALSRVALQTSSSSRAVLDGTIIKDAQHLQKFLDEIENEPVIALDTEANRSYVYKEKVCLIQISTPRKHVLIDPLANISLVPLLETVSKKRLIIHGADYDLRLLRQIGPFEPADCFDTAIAARVCGYEKNGLAAMVEQFFQVTLCKKFQKANWGKRPLSHEMIEYALNDTRYLIKLASILEKKLHELGRWHVFENALYRMMEATRKSKLHNEESAWRIRGSNSLSPRELATLRALYYWREQEARERNWPVWSVMTNSNLLIASKCTHLEQSFDWAIARKCRFSFEVAFQAALKLPESEWPNPEERKSKASEANSENRLLILIPLPQELRFLLVPENLKSEVIPEEKPSMQPDELLEQVKQKAFANYQSLDKLQKHERLLCWTSQVLFLQWSISLQLTQNLPAGSFTAQQLAQLDLDYQDRLKALRLKLPEDYQKSANRFYNRSNVVVFYDLSTQKIFLGKINKSECSQYATCLKDQFSTELAHLGLTSQYSSFSFTDALKHTEVATLQADLLRQWLAIEEELDGLMKKQEIYREEVALIGTKPRRGRTTQPKALCQGIRVHELFLEACQSGDLVIIKRFLQEVYCQDQARKELINKLGVRGFSSLHFACESGQFEVVKLLFEQGGQLDQATDCGKLPIHLAVCKDCGKATEHLLEFLIQEMTQQNLIALEAFDSQERTPLSEAAYFGNIRAARWLLSRNASLENKDRCGRTPLNVAEINGRVDIVALFANYGV